MRIEYPYQSFDWLGYLCKIQFRANEEKEALLGHKVTYDDPWFDGGDSANRTMAYYFARTYYKAIYTTHINQLIDQLECPESPGNYRRHPDDRFWYSKCDRMSRDQAIPLLCLMGLLGLDHKLKDFFKAHLKRGLLFMTNTRRNGATLKNGGTSKGIGPNGKEKFRNYDWKIPDFTGPAIWGLYIRGLRLWYLYPVLILLDLESLVNAVVKKFSTSDDVINHCIICLYGKKQFNNPIMWLTNKINNSEKLGQSLIRFYDGPGLPYWFGQMYADLIQKEM